MRKKNKNSTYRKVANQVFLTILGFVVLGFLSVPLAKKVSKQYKVDKEIEGLEKEINSIEKKNSDLKNLLSYLNSDQFIEDKAREKLNYKKEGEKIIVFDNLENNDKIIKKDNLYNLQIKKKKKKKISNSYKWLKYFFKL